MEISNSPVDLTKLARQAMLERHFLPDYPQAVIDQLQTIHEPAKPYTSPTRDMRDRLWFSLDNDDSKDLDQVTFAETTDTGFRIYIAIADVDAIVKKNSPIDLYAQTNTVTVYTPTKNFSMLPENLSTDLTSLNQNQDRVAIVTQVDVDLQGYLGKYEIYAAFIRSHAKLAYNGVSDWLDNVSSPPQLIHQIPELADQIRLQDQIAQFIRKRRHQEGSLTLETLEPQPVIKNDQVVDMVVAQNNRGKELIEEFMIAANISVAGFLSSHKISSLRRVVTVPKRWDRIQEVARERGTLLPDEPNSKALDEFLIRERERDPLRFPDLSLTIVKLLGNGEYVVEYPNQIPVGHFGLALKDYTHSTAPNRRYPDLITQRMIKAVLLNLPLPYRSEELEVLAKHCSEKEDDADKVSRKMKKCAAIVILTPKLHQIFDGIVTGAGLKGTWVRLFNPPVEGKLIKGYQGVDVGDKITVELVYVDINMGFIDFIKR